MNIPQIYTVGRRTLYEINELLHLSNKTKNQDNARQIITELKTKYKYNGVYNTHYIRQFLKVYNLSEDNELNILYKNMLLEGLIVDGNYVIDDEKYNQISNPHYLQEIRQQAQNELNVQQQTDDTLALSAFEKSKDDTDDVEHNFDELIDSPHAKQNNAQNSFLTNKAMTEQELEPFPRVTFAEARNNGLNRLRRQSTVRVRDINPVDLNGVRVWERQIQRHRNWQREYKIGEI